jgi:hypothetical protein
MKIAWAAALAAGLAGAAGGAPMQCAHDRDPGDRLEDTAGDALWGLSQKFEAEGNDAALRETLEYLVQRYPSNRHSVEARAKLGAASGAAAAMGPDAGMDAGRVRDAHDALDASERGR